jgi:hypothetical protein
VFHHLTLWVTVAIIISPLPGVFVPPIPMALVLLKLPCTSLLVGPTQANMSQGVPRILADI